MAASSLLCVYARVFAHFCFGEAAVGSPRLYPLLDPATQRRTIEMELWKRIPLHSASSVEAAVTSIWELSLRLYPCSGEQWAYCCVLAAVIQLSVIRSRQWHSLESGRGESCAVHPQTSPLKSTPGRYATDLWQVGGHQNVATNFTLHDTAIRVSWSQMNMSSVLVITSSAERGGRLEMRMGWGHLFCYRIRDKRKNVEEPGKLEVSQC